MAKSAFLNTTLIFQSGKETYEVCTDTDYVYIQDQSTHESINIDIDDWFEIITYIEKQLK